MRLLDGGTFLPRTAYECRTFSRMTKAQGLCEDVLSPGRAVRTSAPTNAAEGSGRGPYVRRGWSRAFRRGAFGPKRISLITIDRVVGRSARSLVCDGGSAYGWTGPAEILGLPPVSIKPDLRVPHLVARRSGRSPRRRGRTPPHKRHCREGGYEHCMGARPIARPAQFSGAGFSRQTSSTVRGGHQLPQRRTPRARNSRSAG